jgi:hypothetical protein
MILRNLGVPLSAALLVGLRAVTEQSPAKTVPWKRISKGFTNTQ